MASIDAALSPGKVKGDRGRTPAWDYRRVRLTGTVIVEGRSVQVALCGPAGPDAFQHRAAVVPVHPPASLKLGAAAGARHPSSVMKVKPAADQSQVAPYTSVMPASAVITTRAPEPAPWSSSTDCAVPEVIALASTMLTGSVTETVPD